MGSGSSAATDLISEFEGYSQNNGNFEYVLMHCPDGLFDLEDKLLHGNNALRSDEAIHRFEKCMMILYNTKNYWPGMYKKRVSEQFKTITENFIHRLTDWEHEENIYWYFQQVPDRFFMQLENYLWRILRVIFGKRIPNKTSLKYRGMKIAYPTPEEFYTNARKYLADFYSLMGYEQHNLLLDQFLLPHNLFRINRYFDENVRVIVVDRDPRDVFVLNKYIWLKQGCPVAYPTDAKPFCEYYIKMRNTEKQVQDERILRLHFEDFVYKYQETVDKLYGFLGLNAKHQVYKQTKFDPKVSINNTQVFKSIPQCKEEIELIEKELNRFLYEFPYTVQVDSQKLF